MTDTINLSQLSFLESRFVAAFLSHPLHFHGLTLRRNPDGNLCAFFWREPNQLLGMIALLKEPPKRMTHLPLLHAALQRFAVGVAESERIKGEGLHTYLIGLAVPHDCSRGFKDRYKAQMDQVWDLPLMLVREVRSKKKHGYLAEDSEERATK